MKYFSITKRQKYYYITCNLVIIFICVYATGLATNREGTEVTFENDPLEYDIDNGHGNFQGDMMLTKKQLDFMNGDGQERSLAVSNWPKTGSVVNIPYTLDANNNWSARELQNIRKAMQEYKDKTCIR